MFTINIYDHGLGAGDKGGPLCASKTRKCGPHQITLNISIVKWSIPAKMDHFVDHVRILPAYSFFAAFASLREIDLISANEAYADGSDADKNPARRPRFAERSGSRRNIRGVL